MCFPRLSTLYIKVQISEYSSRLPRQRALQLRHVRLTKDQRVAGPLPLDGWLHLGCQNPRNHKGATAQLGRLFVAGN